MASLNAGLAKLKSEEGAAPAAEAPAKPAPVETAPQAEAVEKPTEKLNDEPKVEAKPAEPKAEDDENAKRGLAAVEKAAKRFREEQARVKAEMDLEKAELARIRSELTGKATSRDELKKLKPGELLDKLELDEDMYETVAREAYARTKAGKASPAAQEAAKQSAAARAYEKEIAELRAKVEELGGEFQKRDKAAETRAFVENWTTQAVKAIPADKPTLIAKLYEKSPEKAKQQLLAVGAELEKANDNETPTHAEVIAEYEKRRRAELEETGVDVDALLAPVKAAPKAAPTKTLDIDTSGRGTRPINGSPTRDQKIASIAAGLKTLNG